MRVRAPSRWTWRCAGLLVLAALAALARLAGSSEPPPVESPAADDGTAETVVLLHGLGRSYRSMSDLADALSAVGYRVVNFDYPSTQQSIDEHADLLAARLAECCLGRLARLHFVTHSLGGIVVRFYLARGKPTQLGRVVMISPPNSGTELVDALRENFLFRVGLGPSAQELGTDPQSVPHQLPPVDFELGVIAGDRTLNPVFSWLIPGADDGTVSVESASTPGMSDFLVVPHSHTFIMNSDDVIEQTIRFLRTGAFDHERDEGSP